MALPNTRQRCWRGVQGVSACLAGQVAMRRLLPEDHAMDGGAHPVRSLLEQYHSRMYL